MYLKFQIVVRIKKEMCLSFYVHKRIREGLSEDWAFRLSSERWEGGSHVKTGGRAIQAEGTELSKAWGEEEPWILGNWKRASIGERPCILIRPFRWATLSCWSSQGWARLSWWEGWSSASLTYKCQQKTSPPFCANSLWEDASFGSGFLTSRPFGCWGKERVHEDNKWKATIVRFELT